jgi:putative ABC transport system permease protein
MKQDILFAVRLFRRQPGLFGLTVAGMAVAIGISTAVFSIVKAAQFGDYGVSNPESVFRVALNGGPFSRTTGDSPFQGNWALSDYRRLEEATSSLSVVASARISAELREHADGGSPIPVDLLAVTGNYFPVLGLHASLGRTLTPADDIPGIHCVVVSHGYWKNRLGADPAIVGRTIRSGTLSSRLLA